MTFLYSSFLKELLQLSQSYKIPHLTHTDIYHTPYSSIYRDYYIYLQTYPTHILFLNIMFGHSQ